MTICRAKISHGYLQRAIDMSSLSNLIFLPKKDVFLATNSLISLCVILCRAYRDVVYSDIAFSHDIFSVKMCMKSSDLTTWLNRRVGSCSMRMGFPSSIGY
jgi:hypothetical protein